MQKSLKKTHLDFENSKKKQVRPLFLFGCALVALWLRFGYS